METLTNILASFDISQVIVNIFPQTFNPILHAFESIFLALFHYGKNFFSAHPGLISGIFIFFFSYITVTGFNRLVLLYALDVRSSNSPSS